MPDQVIKFALPAKTSENDRFCKSGIARRKRGGACAQQVGCVPTFMNLIQDMKGYFPGAG